MGAWFLTRPGDPPPTADPSTPSTSKAADPTATPTVEKRRVTVDDLPPEVDGWLVKPAGTGAYYITDGREDPYGADAQINVTGADGDITVDTATTGLAGPIKSSGGRVVCVPEDIVGNVSCFIETSTFTLIVASATQEDGISLEDAKEAMRLAGHKLPIKTKFVTREGLQKQEEGGEVNEG